MSTTPHDPMMQSAGEPSLWDRVDQITQPPQTRSTSQLAAIAATASMPSRRRAILESLTRDGPQTLFELCYRLRCHPHQISGRLTDLKAECLIEPTGERRPNPATGCQADVYRAGPRRPDDHPL